jgi:hypothetical protein
MGAMSKRLIVVVAVAVFVVLVIVVVNLLTGDDGADKGSSGSATRHEEGSDVDGDASGSGGASALRTVVTGRGRGKNATASAASPSIRSPKEIWLRVSAAPKQEVEGTWNISCGAGNVTTDTFKVTPPHLQKLELPGKRTRPCIAGASAQLSGTGRLKLTILRDR